MTEITDVNYLISSQQNNPSNNIEFEFDDMQAEPQNQNSNQIQHQGAEDQSLLEVLNDSTEFSQEVESYNNQHETDQIETSQYETSQDLTSQYETSQDETGQYETTQYETSQDEAGHDGLLESTNWEHTEETDTLPEESGILEERLSDYEDYDDKFEEERLSDYETSNNETEDYASEECSEGIITGPNPEAPRILNFSLSPRSNRPFELPIIKKSPIIITSKSTSKPNYTFQKQLNNNKTQVSTQGIKRAITQSEQNVYKAKILAKQPKLELSSEKLDFSNQIARTFRVVTSSKTLANSMSPKAVITKNQNVKSENAPQKIIIKEEICPKKQPKNGTNYDSDSEVLLGFDPQSGSFKTKTGYKIETCSFSDSEKNVSQDQSISAADFDSFQHSFNSTINPDASSQYFSDSDISITNMKVPGKSKISTETIKTYHNSSRTFVETKPKLQNHITKTGSRTVITKIMPRFIPPDIEKSKINKNEKPKPFNNNKRTSDEMNVALAMQKLKNSNTNVQNQTDFSKNRNIRKSTETESEDEDLKFALAKFFMECNIPLGVVEDNSFKEFVGLLKPDFVSKLPASKVLLQTILKL